MAGNVLKQLQIGAMVDACEVDMNQQTMFELSRFSLLRIVWIQDPLQAFDCCAFKPLVWIAVQPLQHLEDEVIVWWLHHPFDQMCFPASGRPRNHDDMARMPLIWRISHRFCRLAVAKLILPTYSSWGLLAGHR